MAESDIQALAGADQIRDAMIAMIGQTDASLVIVTDRLNPYLYNAPGVDDALRTRLLERRRLSVRIIVRQPRLALVNSPRLIALARRMASNFQLRVPEGESKDLSSWVVGDRHSLLHRPLCERLDGTLITRSPLRVRDQLGQFETMWNNAAPSIELREFRA